MVSNAREQFEEIIERMGNHLRRDMYHILGLSA